MKDKEIEEKFEKGKEQLRKEMAKHGIVQDTSKTFKTKDGPISIVTYLNT